MKPGHSMFCDRSVNIISQKMYVKILVCVVIIWCHGVFCFIQNSAVVSGTFFHTSSLSSDLIKSIELASNIALDHCQKHFKYDKWNCPQNMFIRHLKMAPNKEAAFSKAILAASLVHTITKSCSKGEIKQCSCSSAKNFDNYYLRKSTRNDQKNSSWSWGGCSDDTTFASHITRTLFEDREAFDEVSMVGKHNYKVGRQIIKDTMIRKCRCHGVSGSCSLQTCWIQVAPFAEISKQLREKYRKAQRLTLEKAKKSVALTNMIKNQKKTIPVRRRDLVYLERSRDYCIPQKTLEWPGTKGRLCSRNNSEFSSVSEKKSCRNICRQCGHKVKKMKRKINSRCNCKFMWCCEVKCETCIENLEEYFCD